jgi:nucleotide-binding universal stress UspA family protein
MKTILVLTGGSETDETVFETAFAAAAPCAAHLEFLHIHLSATEAMAFTPHAEFARGAALKSVLERLRTDAEARSAAGLRRFRQFCEERRIEVTDTPAARSVITAAWRQELDHAAERMVRHARHSDLVVVGRSSRADGLPSELIELLLVGCGCPLLIAPPHPRRRPFDSIVVFWKETAEAARALAAALPLLAASKRIVVASVEENGGSPQDDLDVVSRLAWHGISAEAVWMSVEDGPVHEQLEQAAACYGADLLVMGAFGHSRARELILGGCTQHFLERADWPVLLTH